MRVKIIFSKMSITAAVAYLYRFTVITVLAQNPSFRAEYRVTTATSATACNTFVDYGVAVTAFVGGVLAIATDFFSLLSANRKQTPYWCRIVEWYPQYFYDDII